MARFALCCSTALTCAVLAAAAPAPIEQRAANPTVTISNGIVVGTATGVANQPSVTGLANAYLGVPFADSPPVRFAPPTSAKGWTEPLQAQTLPPACLQQFGPGELGANTRRLFNNPLAPPPAESEDCLYLNVFAPQDASPTNLKPVMFWLFGGNLQFGTASLTYYNGSSLAVNEDVVVVVINYRTNFFGFSSSPEIEFGQQNSGFLDQRFALQWVQDNIAQFGGDPDKVTLFGESAGGYSVKQFLANPPSPLPFRAAIMQSQAAAVTGNGSVNYQIVAEHFGCSTSTSPIECLRKIPSTDIIDYVNEQDLGFPPVSGDGTNLGANTLPSITSGKFADVPVFIGTNKDEARVFLTAAGLDNGTSVVDDVLALAGFDITPFLDTLLGIYAAEATNSSYLLASRILTDLLFTCTTQSFSSAIAATGRQPVWRYFFEGDFPNLRIFNNAGAYHTAEIPEAWGTYPLSNSLGNATPDQIALSKYMQGIWAGFAKDPSSGVGWPKLGRNQGVELGRLGGSVQPAGEQTVALATVDAPCAVFGPLLIAAGNAY